MSKNIFIGGGNSETFFSSNQRLITIKWKGEPRIQLHQTTLFSTDSEYLYAAMAFKRPEKSPNVGKYTWCGLKFVLGQILLLWSVR